MTTIVKLAEKLKKKYRIFDNESIFIETNSEYLNIDCHKHPIKIPFIIFN